MRIERLLAAISLCLCISLPLASCGRRSQLETPERASTQDIRRRAPADAISNLPREPDLEGVSGPNRSFILDPLL